MAKRNKTIYNIDVACAACHRFLFRYAKEGPGHLVKCFTSNITDDQANGLQCRCGQIYAREVSIGGRPARKIIQGKIIVRGHVKS